MEYSLKAKKGWLETRSEISEEMRLWSVDDWMVDQVGKAARLTYIKQGKTIELLMDKQDTAKDNLRVLYLAIRSIRLNEVRGIGEVIGSAYLQLAAPVRKKNPYEVLGIFQDSPIEVAEAVYKAKAFKAHPDKGGDIASFQELKEAIEELREKHKNKT